MAKNAKLRDDITKILNKTTSTEQAGEIIDYFVGKESSSLTETDLIHSDKSIIDKIRQNGSFSNDLEESRKRLGVPSTDYICCSNEFANTYEEVEDELMSHIIFQNNLIEVKTDFNIKNVSESLKKELKTRINNEVARLICKYELPFGYRIFIIKCILNQNYLDGEIPIESNSGNKIRVLKSKEDRIVVEFIKVPSRDEIQNAVDIISAYLGYNVPAELLPKVNITETRNMCQDRDNGMTYSEIAQKYYPQQFASDKVTATDRVMKRITRAQKNLKI